MRTTIILAVLASGASMAGCGLSEPTTPDIASRQVTAASRDDDGPEDGRFNLEVILRGDGFGHVKFRQHTDEPFKVYLDTWVRDLTANTAYKLQRAVDTTIDGECANTSGWLTLGKGSTPQNIVTDDRGTAKERLFRNLAMSPGAVFDINFRVIDATTGAVVLMSDCYTFTIRG